MQVSALGAGTSLIAGTSAFASAKSTTVESQLDQLTSRVADVVPISIEERKSRIAKAQSLMDKNGFAAIVLDSGTSMNYFTGMTWGQSERPMVAIIPAKGEVSYICPKFEESRLEERIILGTKIYAWEEDQSPYEQMRKAIVDSGATSGKIGMEERVRFFIADG